MSETSPIEVVQDIPAKRKRGRPRIHPIKEKGNGKRGRPKKIRDANEPEKIKKKRGRPRKIRDPNEAVKKKGRPRKFRVPVDESGWAAAVEPEVQISESEFNSEINLGGNYGEERFEEEYPVTEINGSLISNKTCQICGNLFQKLESMKPPVNSTLELIACDMCSYYVKPHTLASGNENFNPLRKPNYPCDKCSKSFHNRYHLKRHMIVHSDDRPFKCNLCDQSFKRTDKLTNHIRRKHEDNTVDDRTLKSSILLENSENDRSQFGEPTCEECGCREGVSEMFLDDGNICLNICDTCKILKRNPANDVQKFFICDICQKVFSCKDNLERHRLIHPNEKLFQCDFCEKSFTRKDKLFRHLKTHPEASFYLNQTKSLKKKTVVNVDDILPVFTCEVCGTDFNEKISLETHLLEVHNQKLPCRWCSETFSSRETLRTHMKAHKVEQSYKCPVCEKIINSSKSFRRHVDSHSTETPFKCEVCNKGFKRKDKLKVHSAVHLKMKPYSCATCQVSFTRKDKFVQHNKNIHGYCPDEDILEMNRCDLCEESFTCEDDLSEHKMTHYR